MFLYYKVSFYCIVLSINSTIILVYWSNYLYFQKCFLKNKYKKQILVSILKTSLLFLSHFSLPSFLQDEEKNGKNNQFVEHLQTKHYLFKTTGRRNIYTYNSQLTVFIFIGLIILPLSYILLLEVKIISLYFVFDFYVFSFLSRNNNLNTSTKAYGLGGYNCCVLD